MPPAVSWPIRIFASRLAVSRQASAGNLPALACRLAAKRGAPPGPQLAHQPVVYPPSFSAGWAIRGATDLAGERQLQAALGNALHAWRASGGAALGSRPRGGKRA